MLKTSGSILILHFCLIARLDGKLLYTTAVLAKMYKLFGFAGRGWISQFCFKQSPRLNRVHANSALFD